MMSLYDRIRRLEGLQPDDGQMPTTFWLVIDGVARNPTTGEERPAADLSGTFTLDIAGANAAVDDINWARCLPGKPGPTTGPGLSAEPGEH